MARIHIAHLTLGDPRVSRMRARTRRMRAIRPSRQTELWYRAELDAVVVRLKAAGAEIAEALRPAWPHVGDALPPGAEELIRRLAARFGNIALVAERLTNIADKLSLVRRGLADVDERLIGAIHAAIGINVTSVLQMQSGQVSPIGAAMEQKARENVALIKSIPVEYFDRVRDVVSKGWETGLRWESMVEEIKRVGDITDNRAKVIARDQVSKCNAAFNEVRQTNLGIERYTWSGALDIRERPSHRLMEGTMHRWDAPPEVDGENVHPGEAILCRCAALPQIDLDMVLPSFGPIDLEEAA